MASTVDSERTRAETYHLGLVAGVQNRQTRLTRTHIHGNLLHIRKECLGLCYRCGISPFCAGWKDICRMYRELRSTTLPGESRVKMPLSGCFQSRMQRIGLFGRIHWLSDRSKPGKCRNLEMRSQLELTLYLGSAREY
jgi:hypothetical protein